MPNSRAAEWLIGMFTTRDAAASVAGDLTEEAGSRRPVWFWWHTLRTAAALCGRGIEREPERFTAVVILSLFSYEHACCAVGPASMGLPWKSLMVAILVSGLLGPLASFALGMLASFVGGASPMTACLTLAVIRSSLIAVNYRETPAYWFVTLALQTLAILAAGAFVQRRIAA